MNYGLFIDFPIFFQSYVVKGGGYCPCSGPSILKIITYFDITILFLNVFFNKKKIHNCIYNVINVVRERGVKIIMC